MNSSVTAKEAWIQAMDIVKTKVKLFSKEDVELLYIKFNRSDIEIKEEGSNLINIEHVNEDKGQLQEKEGTVSEYPRSEEEVDIIVPRDINRDSEEEFDIIVPQDINRHKEEDKKSGEVMEVDSDDEWNSEDSSVDFSIDSDDDVVMVSEKTSKSGIDICILGSILEKGKAATMSINRDSNVVLVLGATGVGKSTFIQAVAASLKIVYGFDGALGKAACQVFGDEIEGFEIGHGLQSQTPHVRSFLCQDSTTYYVDSSGFGDTKGIETDIATSICVREIAQRAGKLRFVFLLNAFQFYSDRATEFRKNLELVSKLIGHNFNGYKKAFTFLFTHCNEAFGDVRELIAKSSGHETIVCSMRKNIIRLLGETKKSTRDPPTLSLIKFLRTSIDKGYPYCDVFDPCFSNLEIIRKNIESMKASSSIANPSQVVNCSLTATARIRVDQEIRKRRKDILDKLQDNKFDSHLCQEVRHIYNLCSNLSGYEEAVNDFCCDLKKSKETIQNQLHSILDRFTTNNADKKNENEASVEEVAKNTKKYIDWLAFLNSLASECQNGCKGESYSISWEEVSTATRKELLSQLLLLINQQAEIIETEATNILGFLHDENEKPDLCLAGNQFVNILTWAAVFEESIRSRVQKTETIINKNLTSLLKIYDQGDMLDPIVSLRFFVLMSNLIQSPLKSVLVRGSDIDALNQKHEYIVNITKDKLRKLLINLPNIVLKAFIETPTKAANSKDSDEHHLINDSLSEALKYAEKIHVILKRNKNELISTFADPWWPAIKIALDGFSQHVKICRDLVQILDMNNVHLVNACWNSLHAFIENLPKSMKAADHQFIQELQSFKCAMARKVGMICERVTLQTTNARAKKIEGNIKSHQEDIFVLQALTWLDNSNESTVYPSNEIGELQISAIILKAYDSYIDYKRGLMCSISDNLSVVLTGKGSKDFIQDKISLLRDKFTQLQKAFDIIDDKHLFHETSQLVLKQISEWSNQRLVESLPDSVVNLEIKSTDMNYFIAKKLQTIGTVIDHLLSSYTSFIETAMKKYNNEVSMKIESFSDLDTISKVLNSSKVWSSAELMLPSYKEIRPVVNKIFYSHIEQLNKIIQNRSNTIDLDDIDNRLQHIRRIESSLESHINISNKAWIPHLQDDIERCRVEVDNQFNGFIEDHEYVAIKIHLEKLQKENYREQHKKCMRILSSHLTTKIKFVKLGLEMSNTLKACEVSNVMKLIKIAEDVLGKPEFFLPPVFGAIEPWKLDGISEFLEQDFLALLVKSTKATVNAVRKKEYARSVHYIEYSKFLQQVIPNNKRGDVEAAKRDVDKLFVQFYDLISDFFEAMKVSDDSKVNNPPNTSYLLNSLSQMRTASTQEGCPKRVEETYQNARRHLSDGFRELLSSLKQEQLDGQHMRSIKIFRFFKNEFKDTSLLDHIEVKFDASKELDEVETLNENTKLQFQPAFFDQTIVDKIATELDKLHKLSSKWNPRSWFSSDADYESKRNCTTNAVDDFLNQTKQMVQNYEYKGLAKRIGVLNYIELKIGNHLSRKVEIQNTILSALQHALSNLYMAMKAALYYDFDNFENVLFPKFLRIFIAIVRNQGTMSSDLLKKCTSVCQGIGRKLNCNIFEHTKNLLNEFEVSLEDCKYDHVPSQVENLKSLGIFLITSFQNYRQSCQCDDCKLMNLIREKIAIKKIEDIGSSLFFLGLGPNATQSDAKKAFHKLALIWHPDKNLGNKEYASEIFRKLTSAYELLQVEGNINFYQSYDFLFISKATIKIPTSLRKFTKLALKNKDFQSVTDMLVKVNKINTVFKFSKANSQTFENLIEKEAKGYAHGLMIDIKNAHSVHDFVQLHHSFSSLEQFEHHFKSYSRIVEASLTSTIIENLNESMEKIKSDALFLQGSTENKANEKLDIFALKLIEIGRILDGFPRLQSNAEKIIKYLLNTIDKEPWGVSFIFKLGLLLEGGELSSGSDEEKRIGRVIVGTLPHFSDVRTAVFNREVITADVADSISRTKSQKLTDGALLKDIRLDENALKSECEIYEVLFYEYFTEFVHKGHDELVTNVIRLAHGIGSCSLKIWDNTVKSKITKILAGVFATFTMIKSGESFLRFSNHSNNEHSGEEKDTAQNILFRPHNVQIIAILRLLGIGTSEESLPNHIMEVRTGEGKSIILGALAVVLSLLGFTVRCVCYSEHLSERDNELFYDIFNAFGVAPRVKYSKITTMSEDKVAEKGDIRGLTVDLIKGNTSVERTSHLPPLSSSDLQNTAEGKEKKILLKTQNEEKQNEDLDFAIGSKSGKEKNKSSFAQFNHTNAALPLNGEEVLLVDEVDVFFGPDFYGKTYNQVAEIYDPAVEKLMRKIWRQRSSKPSFRLVSKWVEYNNLLQRFNDWSLQIEIEVRKMCVDVNHFNEPLYEVDTINSRLGYSHLDSVDWDQTYGYRTAFAHLFEGEDGKLVGPTADIVIRKSLCLRISCGQFSYANIQPTVILGVSGTLRVLSTAERAIIQDFGVDTFSFIPSVYGKNNLTFDKLDRGIMIECEKSRHLQEIANAMKQAIDMNRSVIAFFEDDSRLMEFQRSSYWGKFRHANTLLSTVEKETRNYVISKAATSRQVTIASAAFGRGTDFFCKDSKLECSGGMLVIQTFLSEEKSEELQIQGRTARQGKKGSYQMILLDSDLEQKFHVNPKTYKSLPRAKLYNWLDQQRQLLHAKTLEQSKDVLAKAEERDILSRSYLDCLDCGNNKLATKYLNSLYEDFQKNSKKLKFCRLVCLSDATSSMNGLWDKTRHCIEEMLQQIEEIGEGQFELLWIAYRDYSDGHIIQKSKWSKDPKELSEFVNKIQTSGGGDYEEAVELAMKEANDEHEKDPINRVILIGDAPPHYEGCGNRLKNHDHVLSTDYKTESRRFQKNDIPVFTFRLGGEETLVKTFKYIATATGGESHFLNINGNNSNELMDIICENALEEIGGSELVAEYRARHTKC